MTPPIAPPAPTGYRPAPGPLDRVTFFAEQASNRRASWLFGAFAALAAFVTGIPLGVIASPVLYFILMPLGLVLSIVQPHSGWMLLLILPAAIFPFLVGTKAGTNHVTFTTPTGGVHPVHGWPLALTATLIAVIPGALLFLVVWRVVRAVLRRSGTRGILAKLGAREVDSNDNEERLFADVVEEMAVAADIPAPRVAMIDAKMAGGAANAATVGWSVKDATVVVTRPLLDNLTRDQVQAVVARVVASIGNGDLGITFQMLALFQAVRIIQFAVFGVSRRPTLRVFWRCVRMVTGKRTPSADSAADELAVATDLLAVGSFRATLDQALGQPSVVGCVLAPLLFPFRLAAWTIGFIISTSEYLVTGPLVDLALRRRELLSDATAVQLTRNPDGLAGALERLRSLGTTVPGADALTSMFAVWWPGPSLADPKAAMVLFARKPHATAERRLAQLVAMGAHPVAEQRPGVTAAEAFVPTPATGGLNFSVNALVSGVVGVMLFQVVWVMMWMSAWLTSFELFVLGFFGMWLVQHAGPH